MSFSRHINQSNGRMCSVCARCMNRTTTNPVKCKCASEGTRQQPVSQSVNRMEFMKIKKKREKTTTIDDGQRPREEGRRQRWKKFELKSISTTKKKSKHYRMTKNMKEKRLKFVSVPNEFEIPKDNSDHDVNVDTTTITRQCAAKKTTTRERTNDNTIIVCRATGL